MPQFKVGDIVSILSGGPGMTVTAVDGEIVSTIWYDGQNHMCEYDFHSSLLKDLSSDPDILARQELQRMELMLKRTQLEVHISQARAASAGLRPVRNKA